MNPTKFIFIFNVFNQKILNLFICKNLYLLFILFILIEYIVTFSIFLKILGLKITLNLIKFLINILN